MVTVRAPATSANLGSGFDTFAVALDDLADRVTVERADTTTIEVTGRNGADVPTDPGRNTAGVVADALGVAARIHIEKGIRPSSGLGSSGASAAGTAVGLNRLYDLGYSAAELVRAAAEGEAAVAGSPHADNVAAAIHGGFTIVSDGSVTPIDVNVPLVLCLPETVVSTEAARTVLPESVSLTNHVETVANAARLVVGMCRSDPGLIGRGMADPIVTPARAELLPGFEGVVEAASAAGATGVAVSGAGPAMLAVCERADRSAVARSMVDVVAAAGMRAEAIETRVGPGATIE